MFLFFWVVWGTAETVEGETGVSIPALDGPSWRPLRFPRIARQTRYTPATLDGRAAIHAESACSASARIVSLEPFDLRKTPLLRWEWKVDRDLPLTNPRTKSGDDFAARVYLVFRFEPESASAWERIRRRTARLIFGEELPGYALNYVWTRSAAAGSRWPSPFTSASWVISLGAGRAGEWKQETVDVWADYSAHFGTPGAEREPRVSGLALMTDSDGSCSSASAWFAGFRFLEHPASGAAQSDQDAPAAKGSVSGVEIR